jgi:hypothetical protein
MQDCEQWVGRFKTERLELWAKREKKYFSLINKYVGLHHLKLPYFLFS